MEQIQQYAKTYQEYKAELDTELSKTAEGFVRIGYLLKVARDTDVLAQSPYQTVTEFARAEYGIDKTVVSRFISINDRFSEGGYSDQLQEQFRGYGYSKLALMLSLPDEITQELSPAYSKAEIQAIKDEVDEERAISDLEVMMEGQPDQAPGSNLLDILIHQLGEDSPDLYVQMAKIMALVGAEWVRAAKEIMAPNGEKQYSIRISGIGRYLVSIRDTEDTITTTSLRTMEKHTYDYPALMGAWEEILPPSNGQNTAWTEKDCRMSWELTYDREYPGKAEVAPVQQKNPAKTESKPMPRKESKVQKAPVPPKKKTPAPAAPPEEEKFPAEESEKPKSTGTEPVSEETVQETLETERTVPETDQETEKPEETGTEGRLEPEIEFVPGMRVRNKTGKPAYPNGDPCYPQSVATIIGRHPGFNAWDAMWDGIPEMKCIYDLDIKEFEIVEEKGWQPPEKENQPDTPVEDQLPGQIELEEAIAEAEERNGAVSYGQESALDKEWENEKKDFLDDLKRLNTEGSLLSSNLSQIPYVHIVAFRTSMINMAALIEKELLRRGREF